MPLHEPRNAVQPLPASTSKEVIPQLGGNDAEGFCKALYSHCGAQQGSGADIRQALRRLSGRLGNQEWPFLQGCSRTAGSAHRKRCLNAPAPLRPRCGFRAARNGYSGVNKTGKNVHGVAKGAICGGGGSVLVLLFDLLRYLGGFSGRLRVGEARSVWLVGCALDFIDGIVSRTGSYSGRVSMRAIFTGMLECRKPARMASS